MAITIKPEGECYIVLRDGLLAGYIAFRSGDTPWVVCTVDGEELSAHVYLADARAAAKQHFASAPDHSRHCRCAECDPDTHRTAWLLDNTGGDGTTPEDVKQAEQELARDAHLYPQVTDNLPF